MLNNVSDLLKVFLQVAQMITILYAVYKFSRKPHDTLEEQHKALEKRVDVHDVKLKDMENSLLQGNDRFREQSEEIHKLKTSFKSVVLAFINFEIAYCIDTKYENTKELVKAKEALEKYLKDE